MIPGEKELRLFPGCALEGAGREYGLSTMAVLAALGRPVRVLTDWNCCGAMAARGMDPQLSVRLSGRNLALAATQNCDVLVGCAACYNNLAFARRQLQEHPESWPYSGGAAGLETVRVEHLLGLLTEEPMRDRIAAKVVRPLDDMRLACYYGCLLVRPGGYTDVDDIENPRSMDRLMNLVGARTIDWSYKTDCCGGSAAVTDRETTLRLVARLFEDAQAQGAGGIVTACPLCHMNLDAWQGAVGEVLVRPVSVPIYYFTELLALAMGLPEACKWLGGHVTEARPTVGKCR